MLIMGFEGPSVYWGFPYIDKEDNHEYWWVQIHLYRSKEYDHKIGGNCMFTNTVMHPSFLVSSKYGYESIAMFCGKDMPIPEWIFEPLVRLPFNCKVVLKLDKNLKRMLR